MAKNRHKLTGRAAILPNKVARERQRFDLDLYLMDQQITKAFPDPTARLKYINDLMAAMDDHQTKTEVPSSGD